MMHPTLRVAELRIHPLKSGGIVRVDRVDVDALGPRHDRRWMAVGPAGDFLTQREVPRLARVRPILGADDGGDGAPLVLEAPGLPRLRVPRARAPRTVRVWQDTVEARDCGDAAAEWLTAALERPARLVHISEGSGREIPAPYGRPGARVAFSDALPFLILTRASVEDLNRRLPAPLPIDRFRPNLVIEGAAAYTEDRWRRIRIGGLVLDVVKPCARCVVTATDQETGARGKEPLRTLAGYRKRDGHVWFAQNAVHLGTGVLEVGAAVEVLETGAPQEFEAAK